VLRPGTGPTLNPADTCSTGVAPDRVAMTLGTGGSEVWKAKIGHECATKLRADGDTLGVSGSSEIVKVAL
jgi:hypothetical protein